MPHDRPLRPLSDFHARTGLDQLTVPVDETTNPDEVVSVLAHRLLSG